MADNRVRWSIILIKVIIQLNKEVIKKGWERIQHLWTLVDQQAQTQLSKEHLDNFLTGRILTALN